MDWSINTCSNESYNREKAMKTIDMNTILLFVGSLALAKGIDVSGAGKEIANVLINTLGKNPSPMYCYL